MEKNELFKKGMAVGIIVLFICAGAAPSIVGDSEESNQVDIDVADVYESQENVAVTCRTFGNPGLSLKEIEMPYSEVEILFDKINDLAVEIARDPLSGETQQLQQEIITVAGDYDLLPREISAETLQPSIPPFLNPPRPWIRTLPYLQQGRASASFCNFVTTGSGSQFPIIVLPRLIPILLTPIPRAFLRWSASEGYTSCGSLLTGKGFIAEGMQRGLALGFWGIGFSVFLPPVMAYGFIGYALFTTCTAEEVEFWPPNSPPVISNENPPSGTWNVPVSLSELSFRIEDGDGDRMSYTVTTEPNIGSGSGNNKKNGFYSVPISGLEHDKIYRWTVEVTDGRDTTVQRFSFITEAKPPFDPFDEGWQYRKNITIDHTKVMGDLENFPVLISYTDADLRDKAQPDGNDILFMNASGVGTRLFHEIESYDEIQGELVAWVKIPELTDTTNTIIWLYYGHLNCTSQQFPTAVWNQHYLSVQHLNEQNGVYEDSTSNQITGYLLDENSNSIQGYGGKIDSCINLYGDLDYINFGTVSQYNTPQSTVSCWFKVPSDLIAGTLFSVGKHPGNFDRWHTAFAKDAHLRICNDIDNSGNYYTSLDAYNDDTWYYMVATIDGSSHKLFINSYLVAEGSSAKTWANIDRHNSFIGARVSVDPGPRGFLKGCVDEMRISNIPLNQEWITTEFNNQNDPSSFLSFGPEEPCP